MVDVYEINLKTGISIKKLKSMDRLGFLKTTKPDNPEVAKMEWTLRKGNPLSVVDLIRLIETPNLMFDLGSHIFTARKQIEALGDAKGEAAKPAIAMVIDFASRDRPDEVEALEKWMKRIIPADGEVPHQFLATRALLGTSPHSRRYLAGRVAKAFLNVKKRPSFSGWFTLRATRYARNATFYHRPKLDFDL